MVFYTWVTWESSADGNQGEHFNWVLVTPDQETADTFYRTLQRVKSVTWSDTLGNVGAKYTFTALDRFNSQFWTYDTDNGENFHIIARALCGNPKQKEVNPEFRSVFGKIRVFWLGEYGDIRLRTWFPQEDSRSDNLSGHAFFIKRRGYDQYWYAANSGNVIVDSNRRSRFVITIVRKHDDQVYPKMPLIGDDEIHIEVLQDGAKKSIGIDYNDQLVVGTGSGEHKIYFRGLKSRFKLSGKWSNDGKEQYTAVQWTGTQVSNADSFEITDGIEVDDDE